MVCTQNMKISFSKISSVLHLLHLKLILYQSTAFHKWLSANILFFILGKKIEKEGSK